MIFLYKVNGWLLISTEGFPIGLILLLELLAAVGYSVFFLANLLFFNLFSMFAQVQEANQSPEPTLNLTLIVPAHKFFKFVNFILNHKRLTIDWLDRAE